MVVPHRPGPVRPRKRRYRPEWMSWADTCDLCGKSLWWPARHARRHLDQALALFYDVCGTCQLFRGTDHRCFSAECNCPCQGVDI